MIDPGFLVRRNLAGTGFDGVDPDDVGSPGGPGGGDPDHTLTDESTIAAGKVRTIGNRLTIADGGGRLIIEDGGRLVLV